MSDWHEDALRHKYDPLPEEGPRHRKKAKKRHVRSDHRHDYETVCVDAHSFLLHHGTRRPLYHIAYRCKVCGRLRDSHVVRDIHEPPEGMPLYEVRDFLELALMRELPEERRVR